MKLGLLARKYQEREGGNGSGVDNHVSFRDLETLQIRTSAKGPLRQLR